jgi:hypothetical protein
MPQLADVPMFVNDFGTNPITTPSFTPADGEVIVVCGACSDGTISMGAPTGGSLSFGAAKAAKVPGGFAGSVVVYAVQVGTSPGAMTLTSTPSGSVPHSMTVYRLVNAALAATPASGTAQGVSGAPSASLTTTGAKSMVVWASSDVQSTDPVSRAYLGSAIEGGLYDGHGGANGVHYSAYQTVNSAGSVTFGLSAPTPQQWVIAGIEVLDVPVEWAFGYDVKIG